MQARWCPRDDHMENGRIQRRAGPAWRLPFMYVPHTMFGEVIPQWPAWAGGRGPARACRPVYSAAMS